MLHTILSMYITLFPAILAGIFNMVWCKTSFLLALQKPMDNNCVLKDGNRLFGDNKTWKGFIGMICLGLICTVLWGFICQLVPVLTTHNYFYHFQENTILYNSCIGVLLGLMYVLCELPNSFIKRRIGIEPGKTKHNRGKYLFVFIDQADSVLGMVLIVALFYPMQLWFGIVYVMIGAATHIIINIGLYKANLRKNRY